MEPETLEIPAKKKFKWFDAQSDWGAIKFFIFCVAFMLVIIFVFEIFSTENTTDTANKGEGADAECNVYGFEIYGELAIYNYVGPDGLPPITAISGDIADVIDSARENEKVKAVILNIDSGGGSPVAGEEVANALKRFDKPTVAVVRDSALSAAYLAASGADLIIASKNSDIGSIGVTMSYLDNVEKNKKEGLNFVSLSSGKFKDAGSPDIVLSPEAKELFARDLKIVHNNFITQVAENRKLDKSKVEKMADGSSVLGEAALNSGLIDRIGDMNDAREYLKEKMGEAAEICW
jgi:protease-4